MYRNLLRSKIHRATVTHCELHYEGSCAIDEDLLLLSDICENEQVHIWNVDNGERLVTYAIRAKAGSGIVSLNGSAARRAAVGDRIIIASFALIRAEQAQSHQPKLVFVDERNRATATRTAVPVQMPCGGTGNPVCSIEEIGLAHARGDQ
jgi:aspartate 1-decarboxylase